jgi:hypothetical protein
MHIPERTMAFTGILKTGCTRIQNLEKGRAPSRETAQSVREEVVAIFDQSAKNDKVWKVILPLATKQPKKQNAKSARKIEAAGADPVPWK